MSMSPVPPSFAYAHSSSKTSASPVLPFSKSGESAEGPCSSLTAPVWPPVGTFQNVPQTPWSYNAVYPGYDQPHSEYSPPPSVSYMSSDQATGPHSHRTDVDGVGPTGNMSIGTPTSNGWQQAQASAAAHSHSHPHPYLHQVPGTGIQWSGQGPVDHPPPSTADPWIMSHRPPITQFHYPHAPQTCEGVPKSPPPPNTATLTTPTADMTPYTTLSPLFVGFSTASPTSAQTPLSAVGRPGPMRGWTYSSLPKRRRSSTLLTQDSAAAASSSPATPQSTTVGTYPYPSPSLARRPSSSTFNSNMNNMVMSTPMTGPRRVFHPSPESASPATVGDWSYTQTSSPDDYVPHRISHPGPPKGVMGYDGFGGLSHLAEVKPPRFRPTKEQLEVLIAAYEENKNPDGPTREMLAKRLGPDVRPKTLQIWFQNRRSKSRAKEREAAIPRSLAVKGRTSPTTKDKSTVDMEALRGLAHDDDPTLAVLPLTVLSLGSWTRFLTPGAGYQTPDLGCVLSLSHDPRINFYVVHQKDTFRISIPINQNTISSIAATSNEQSHAGQVAISFDLARGVAEYAGWGEIRYGPESTGKWRPVGDFTGGQQASAGGRCELTGPRGTLLPAFAKVQGIVAGLSSPPPTESLVTPTEPIDTQQQPQHQWYPPTLSASSEDAPLAAQFATTQEPLGLHVRQTSFSLPDPIKPESVSANSTGHQQPLPPLHRTQPPPTHLDLPEQRWTAGPLGSRLDMPTQNSTPSIECSWNAFPVTTPISPDVSPSASGQSDQGHHHQSFTALHDATYVAAPAHLHPAMEVDQSPVAAASDKVYAPAVGSHPPSLETTAQSSPLELQDARV